MKNPKNYVGRFDKKLVDYHLDRLDSTNISRRDFMALVTAGAAASATAVALGSPGVAMAADSGKIAFIAFTSRNEYCFQSSLAIKAAAEELGFGGFSFLDGQFDSERMLNQSQTEATSGTVAMVLMATDGSMMRRVSEIAEQNKMFFGNVWGTEPWYTPFDASKYYGFFAVPDEFAAHRAVTSELLKSVTEKFGGGEIVGVTGIPGFTTDIIRSRGRDDAFKDYPKTKLVGQLPGNWNREDSLKATENLLARYPNVKGIVAQNDDIAEGVIAALRAGGLRAGEDVLVTGADGTNGAVKAIAEGQQLSTSANSPAFMGAFFTSYLYDLVHGWEPRPAERMLHWRSVTLTKDNVEAYKERYVDNGDVQPFDYAKMSKVRNPTNWDPQNEVFPLDMDYEFTGIDKPANFQYPSGYLAAKAQWAEVAADYKAHYKTPFMGPSPKKA